MICSMRNDAKTVAQYLAGLPADRRAALEAVRAVILRNLDPDFEEGIQYGMIGYSVPHRVYPPGYHCNPELPLPFAALASQKNHMSLSLMSVYGEGNPEEQWLRKAWAVTGKKLDMGKCCIRFKRVEDLPLEVVGKAFRRVKARDFARRYEEAMAAHQNARKARKPAARNKAGKTPGRAKSKGSK